MGVRLMTLTAEWQLVLVLWGDKYSNVEVSHLIETAKKHSSRPFRTVLLTDRMRDGLPEDVLQRLIPEFYSADRFRLSGCQAKLSVFSEGVVPQDLPAIFVDIDTVVLGDMARFLKLPKSEQSVVIFQSAIIPIGWFGRCLYKFTKKRKYARGNSSIIVFHPKECGYIDRKFRALDEAFPELLFRPMISDERFISWVAQPHLQAIPKSLAVKFPTEFMWSHDWVVFARAKLPWSKRRWRSLVAVTLPGVEVKGHNLLKMPEGTRLRDGKGRKLIWSERAIGPMKDRLTQYYSALVAQEQESHL